MIGVGLTTCTLSIPGILIVMFAAYYPVLIAAEERRLSIKHGDQLAIYRQATSAFWPRISTYREPESYEFRPRVIRKNLADAAWFLLLMGIGHLVAELHDEHVLPSVWLFW